MQRRLTFIDLKIVIAVLDDETKSSSSLRESAKKQLKEILMDLRNKYPLKKTALFISTLKLIALRLENHEQLVIQTLIDDVESEKGFLHNMEPNMLDDLAKSISIRLPQPVAPQISDEIPHKIIAGHPPSYSFTLFVDTATQIRDLYREAVSLGFTENHRKMDLYLRVIDLITKLPESNKTSEFISRLYDSHNNIVELLFFNILHAIAQQHYSSAAHMVTTCTKHLNLVPHAHRIKNHALRINLFNQLLIARQHLDQISLAPLQDNIFRLFSLLQYAIGYSFYEEAKLVDDSHYYRIAITFFDYARVNGIDRISQANWQQRDYNLLARIFSEKINIMIRIAIIAEDDSNYNEAISALACAKHCFDNLLLINAENNLICQYKINAIVHFPSTMNRLYSKIFFGLALKQKSENQYAEASSSIQQAKDKFNQIFFRAEEDNDLGQNIKDEEQVINQLLSQSTKSEAKDYSRPPSPM